MQVSKLFDLICEAMEAETIATVLRFVAPCGKHVVVSVQLGQGMLQGILQSVGKAGQGQCDE